jgi:hypothetical protein
VGNSATSDPGLEIKGCTALIQSGQWPERYVAFAYNVRGAAYQGNGDFVPFLTTAKRSDSITHTRLLTTIAAANIAMRSSRYSELRTETPEAIGDR